MKHNGTSLYYSKLCRSIRIKPYDDRPILNDAQGLSW